MAALVWEGRRALPPPFLFLILYKGEVVALESLRNPYASRAESPLGIRIAFESLSNRS